MIHLYPFTKKALLLISFGIFSVMSFAQVCGPVVENFDNTGGSMAGFSSSTQGSGAPGFVFGNTGPNGYLERCGIPAAGTTYQISTPVYLTLASQTSLGFGFELGGQTEASQVYFFVDYFNTNTGSFTSTYIAAINPVYVANTATICLNVPFSSIPGFLAGGVYRLDIFLISASSSNSNQCIRFDNFRTTGAATQITLPVSFTSFVAKKSGSAVQLTWNVAGEKEVSHYEVEKSTDSRTFTKIGEVTADGLSAYSFTDKQATSGVVYYRVRNVDVDGKYSYTKVARVNLNKFIALTAYPQPLRNDVTVEHGASLNGKLTIATANGQVVKTVAVKADAIQTVINVSGLNSGLYIIRFDNGQGGTESIKMIKQ